MGRLIGIIYFYLVSLIGLILLLVGLYNSVTYLVNITQYEIYPLQYAESCETYPTVAPFIDDGNVVRPVDAPMQNENYQRQCEERVAVQRKTRQVDDLKNAIYFTVAGVLLLSIHLPFGLRRSREKN